MKVEERNQLITYWLHAKLSNAKLTSDSAFAMLDNKDIISQILTNLIETNAKGFRGVVLTSLAGYQVDPLFNPLIDFYACNPRSIFEHSIWYVLSEFNIPCGKSDPLNVAKNINTLDRNWAKDRRPEKTAIAAVEFLELFFENQNNEQRILLENYFFYRLVKYAKSIAEIDIYGTCNPAASRQWMAENLIGFSQKAPESGASPQLLISSILTQLFAHSELSICGGNESVFGTNTTSKKPADIWIEDSKNVSMLYEVTLKKVDQKRIEDFIESTRAMRLEAVPVTFICRIPEDISTLESVKANTLHYKGINVEFVDYSSFIRSAFSLLSNDSVVLIHDTMRDFVGRITTSIKAKEIWNIIWSGAEQNY